MISPSPISRRGSALILVLWCLLLLGMAVIGVTEMVELSVEHSGHNELAFEARTQALSGVALGLNPQLYKNDPVLSEKPEPDRSFTATISNEGARLNLNYVLASGHREILQNLFTHWGLDPDQSSHVIDCLTDWITPGDLKSLNGAKASDYEKAGLPQRPTGKPFASLDEVESVMGMNLVAKAKPDWQSSLTLWSSGPLNINEADPELIAAVFGLDIERVETFTRLRNGRDGIAGTLDDQRIVDLQSAQGQLGITDLAMKSLADQISLNDTARRVESVGQAGAMTSRITVVTQLNSAPAQYLLWSER